MRWERDSSLTKRVEFVTTRRVRTLLSSQASNKDRGKPWIAASSGFWVTKVELHEWKVNAIEILFLSQNFSVGSLFIARIVAFIKPRSHVKRSSYKLCEMPCLD